MHLTQTGSMQSAQRGVLHLSPGNVQLVCENIQLGFDVLGATLQQLWLKRQHVHKGARGNLHSTR